MLYYKPKHLKSVVPSIFTTEPQSAADSIIMDSRILSEEKLNLNNKFALLDQFSHRAFDIKEYNLTQREVPSRKKHFIQNNKLDVWGETTLTLYRNQFLYTSLDIHEKYSPVVLLIYVKKGDPNTKMRLFCSVRFQQPNRFNAEIETYGRVLKYHSRDGTTFYDPILYVAILAHNDVVITIKNEFAKPPIPRKIPQIKKKDEQNIDFEELSEQIIRKRKLRQKSLNFINLNRLLIQKQKIESPCNSDRLKEIKFKQTIIQKEQNLKHIAQIALHDVAKEIKQKQMNIQLKQMHKEWIQKKWIQIVILINYIVPSISNYIKVQKRISEKNMRKQILTMQYIHKIKNNILHQGPKIKLRTLLICKMSMQICINSQQNKIKQKCNNIIIEILRQNIRSYYTVTKGLHTVNLIKKCINMLVRHKNKRLEFMQQMKITIFHQCKQIYGDILKMKQQSISQLPLQQQQQLEKNKNKRDPLHYLIHDQYRIYYYHFNRQFIMFIYKKLFTNVLQKWNQDFDAFRKVYHESQKKGLALLLRPLPLEIPQEEIINNYIIDELDRRGLINYQYYPAETLDLELSDTINKIYSGCQKINDKHLKIRILQWLDKVRTPTHNFIWKQNSLLYARVLLEMTLEKQLDKPFRGVPPDGPLPRLDKFDVPQQVWQKLKQFQQPQSPRKPLGMILNRNLTPKLKTEPVKNLKNGIKSKRLQKGQIKICKNLNNFQKIYKLKNYLFELLMLFIILQILLTQAQENQTNSLYLFNQSALEIQVILYSHINQPFILASSNKKFENIFYVEGQDKIQSLNYDHESFITNNDIHIIFTEPAIDLYIYAGYLNQSYNQYSNFSILIKNQSGQCPSFCIQQGNTCNSINKQCLCKSGYFGQFCQLQRKIAVLQIQYDIIIKPLQWIYIGFETKQLNTNDTLKLRIRDQSSEMLMGLGMQGIENHEVPNIHYDAYIIPKKIQQQIYQLKGDLIYYQSMCMNCSFLNIGFYNQHSYPILFYFELFEKEQSKENDPYHLQIILQSIFLTCFIMITYLIFRKIRQKQQREQIRLVQREFRGNRRRRIIQQQQQSDDIQKGFNLDFIQTYFPQFYYLDLIDKYPQLNEFIECVVCLESMAPPQQGKLTERDHIDHCSLTPCYHLFHQHCLFKWLQTQKCCPLCRKEFIEQDIKNKPWISLNNDISLRETSRANPFVQRMKTRSENTQQSDIPLMGDTENIETQPNKDIIVNIAQKSARDLIIR